MTPATARTFWEIKRICADHFGVDGALIDTMQKPARLSIARSAAMFFCREFLRKAGSTKERVSYPQIAGSFKRDAHGSAMFAERTIRGRVDIDQDFAREIKALRERIASSLKNCRETIA
jgi:chromosomal replication initiation ATPase DnaA